ncbi:hypothetical protein HZC53_00805 [Candidatus Uhrbacteria bacterium]|nr:hypothetical protein [Candidatus Uhrbacteria bacterium]
MIGDKKLSLNWHASVLIFLVALASLFGFLLNGFSVNQANAATPTTLGYQGRLRNSAGTALSGTYNFTFRLYSTSTGGVALWSETQSVSVDTGFFAVQLGSSTAFPTSLDFNLPMFITTEVGSDGEMSPRVAINSVAYAFTAGGINSFDVAPVSATGGRMYYDNSNGSLYYYDGLATAWQQIGTATGTLQTITNSGNVTTNAIQFAGGTSTGNFSVSNDFTVTGSSSFQNITAGNATFTGLTITGSSPSSFASLTWTNATGTNTTSTNLFATNGTITNGVITNGTVSNLTFTDGTSTSWLGFATASGTTLNASNSFIASLTAPTLISSNVTITGGTINGTSIGATTPSTGVFTNTTSTNSTSTNLFATNATIQNLTITGVAPSSFSNLIWVSATGTYTTTTNLAVLSGLSLPGNSVTDAMVVNGLTIDQTGNVSATSINSGVLGNAGVTLNLSGFGSVTGTISADQVTATTTLSQLFTAQQAFDFYNSNDVVTGGLIIQSASGTVDVGNGRGFVHVSATDDSSTSVYVSWASTTGIVLPANEWRNIYVFYNDGSPSTVVTSTDLSENLQYIKLGEAFNVGDGEVEIGDRRILHNNFRARISRYLDANAQHVVSSGCELSSTGTRQFVVSACVSWTGVNKQTMASLDTSSGIPAFYRDGSGGFTVIDAQTQWDNLNYDDGTGVLAPIGVGEYGVHWIYVHEVGGESKAHIVYGRSSYTLLTDAASASPPTDLPLEFLDGEHTFLIGAIVFLQGSAVETQFVDRRPLLITYGSISGSGGGTSDHNSLTGLQGGSAGQYYHLTASGFASEDGLAFSSNAGGLFTLSANATTDTKIVINNAYAGTASLDIREGDLQLASTTRITNAGYAYLTGLDLTGGSISGISNLTATGTTSLATLTFTNGTATSVTSTNLFATNAAFTNLTVSGLAPSLFDNLIWTNATGTYTTSTYLYASVGRFGELTATSATFTNAVVMQQTDVTNLTFTNATGGNLVTYGIVSSTFIQAGDTILNNTTAHSMVIDETLRVGAGNFSVVGNSVAQFGGTTDTYLQINIQNQSSGTSASSDFVATNDIGDDSNYYIDMGINSSGYSSPSFDIGGANDGYLYTQGNNLTIGTASASTAVIFHAGGTMTTDEVMRITSDHYVGIGTTAPSSTLHVVGTSTMDGLLTVTTASSSILFFGSSTGSSLYVNDLARLPGDTKINNTAVCLLDGTNCPSGTSPNFQTVTNTGNTTTRDIQFNGGTSTGDFTIQGGLLVYGSSTLQDFSFVNSTGNALYLSGSLRANNLEAGNAILENTTATNMVIETLKVGPGENPVLGVSIAQFGGSFNNYLVIDAMNHSTGTFATSNFVTSADVATPGNNYNTAIGIANSGFSSPLFTIASPLDSYLMGNSSDLIVVAATSSSVIKFAAGGTLAANEVMRITSDHYVGIGTTAPSSTLHIVGTSTMDGSLTVTTASSSILFFGSSTGSSLYVNDLARLPGDTKINNTAVCLLDGTNCPSGTTPNFQTVTNTGNTTTNALQFAGGTSTANFNPGTDLAYSLGIATHRWNGYFGETTSTNATATSLFATYGAITNGTITNGTISNLTFTNGTSTSWLGFATASGTTINALSGYIASLTAPTLISSNATLSGGSINGMTIGAIIPSTGVFTDVTSTSATTTNLFATNATIQNLTVTGATPSNFANLTWTNATGTNTTSTNLAVLTYARLPADTQINSTAVCLLDGTNCPSGASPSFQTVTNSGSSTTNAIQFNGGTSTGAFLVGANLTVTGTTAIQGLTFTVATGTSVTTTNFYAALAQITSATTTNLSVLGYVGSSLVPSLNSALSLGSSALRWDLWFGSATGANIGVTNLNVTGTASTVNLTWTNATGTSVTTTNLFATNAMVTNFTGTTGNIANLTWTNATGTSVTTTNLFATNATISNLTTSGNSVVSGSLTIGASTAGTSTRGWKNSNLSATGINSIRSMQPFNGYLYAGRGDGAADGDVMICDPSSGGDSQLCDVSGDWSSSDDSATASQVSSMTVYLNRLYIGQGDGAGLGIIRYCNPGLTGTAAKCDSGDWAVATSTGLNRIRQFANYNGYLYAVGDNNSVDTGAFFVCNPALGGNTNECDNTADWSRVNLSSVLAGYEELTSLVVYRARLYAGVGNSAGDNDLFICNPTLGGNTEACDATADWSRIYNAPSVTYNAIEKFSVLDDLVYLGMGNGAGEGDLVRCDPKYAGDLSLCDNAGDFNSFTPVIQRASGNRVTALMPFQGMMMVGYEGASGDGDIDEFRETYASTTDDTASFEATYAFAEYNGFLYAGRGNAAGNGQVFYYSRDHHNSNQLTFESPSSSASIWYSEDSADQPFGGRDPDTYVGTFKFSHGLTTEAGAYDLAEMYPVSDASLSSGDVVALDENLAGSVRKSSSAYDPQAFGVISTKPGFTLSAAQREGMKPVALAGRVPVKITTENGPIKVGDPLAAASVPGYAMKASRAGSIVGRSMQDFSVSADTASSTVATGTVEMIVQPGYYFGSNEGDSSVGQLAGFLEDSTSTTIIAKAASGDIGALLEVAAGTINPQVAAGDSLMDIRLLLADIVVVRSAALVAGDLTVGGTVRLTGHVIVSDDTAGVIDMPVGESFVEVKFSKPYESVPVVVVTPESDAQEYFTPWLGKFRIAKKTVDGFRIEVEEGACTDPSNCGRTLRFNWLALGTQVSATSTAETPVTEPEPEAVVPTSTEEVPVANPSTPEEQPVTDIAPTTTEEPAIPTDETPASETPTPTVDVPPAETQPETVVTEPPPTETVTPPAEAPVSEPPPVEPVAPPADPPPAETPAPPPATE